MVLPILNLSLDTTINEQNKQSTATQFNSLDPNSDMMYHEKDRVILTHGSSRRKSRKMRKAKTIHATLDYDMNDELLNEFTTPSTMNKVSYLGRQRINSSGHAGQLQLLQHNYYQQQPYLPDIPSNDELNFHESTKNSWTDRNSNQPNIVNTDSIQQVKNLIVSLLENKSCSQCQPCSCQDTKPKTLAVSDTKSEATLKNEGIQDQKMDTELASKDNTPTSSIVFSSKINESARVSAVDMDESKPEKTRSYSETNAATSGYKSSEDKASLSNGQGLPSNIAVNQVHHHGHHGHHHQQHHYPHHHHQERQLSGTLDLSESQNQTYLQENIPTIHERLSNIDDRMNKLEKLLEMVLLKTDKSGQNNDDDVEATVDEA